MTGRCDISRNHARVVGIEHKRPGAVKDGPMDAALGVLTVVVNLENKSHCQI